MKYWLGASIIIFSAVMWFLGIGGATQHFIIGQRTDTYSVTTAAGASTANIALHSATYEGDATSITVVSSIGEAPAWASYNNTTHSLALSNLTDNATRTISASYNVLSPLMASMPPAITFFQDVVPLLYYITFTVLPIVAIVMMVRK